MNRSRAQLAAVFFALTLGGCDNKVNLFYRPLTFCVGVLNPKGGVLVEEIVVFRLDSVNNRTTAATAVWPGYFFVRRADTRLATQAAQLLTNLPEPLRVGSAMTERGPWIVAMRARDYERAGFSEPDGDGTVRVRFLPLRYDPSLGAAPDSTFLAINTSGRWTLPHIDRRPCTVAGVRALP